MFFCVGGCDKNKLSVFNKRNGWSAAKEIYSLAVFVIKLLLILAITIPIIIIWLYIILTFDGSQIDEISFSQFVASGNVQYFSFIISVCVYAIYRFLDFNNRKIKKENRVYFNYTDDDAEKILKSKNAFYPDDELFSWIDEGELVVEQYMSKDQVGRLVKQYMIETNGMPLKIVFPEYDKGSDQ